MSARTRSAGRRREREREYNREESLKSRTRFLTNRYGERRHVVDWSDEDVKTWTEQEFPADAASSAATSIPAKSIIKKNKKKNFAEMILRLLRLGKDK